MALKDNSEQILRNVNKRVEETMKFTGAQFERDAKSLNTYTDRTSNLRNSIGSDVKPIQEGYQLKMEAGMNYAAAVEAKGFDVISGPTRKAKETFTRMLEKTLRDEAGR